MDETPGAAPLAPVAFDFSAGEERTARVEAPGVEPFDITFEVPGGLATLGILTAADAGERGDEIVGLIARHLRKWSLPQPAAEKSLRAIRDPGVLLAIYAAIRAARDEVKNS